MKGDEAMAYTIFNMRLAGYLMQHGETLIDMRPNELRPCRNVFYFRYTDTIDNAIRDWKRTKETENDRKTDIQRI